MRCRFLTPDRRFAEALDRDGPEAVRFLVAANAAAAVRVWAAGEAHAAVVDVAADPRVADEILTWWGANPSRDPLPLLFAGATATQSREARSERRVIRRRLGAPCLR